MADADDVDDKSSDLIRSARRRRHYCSMNMDATNQVSGRKEKKGCSVMASHHMREEQQATASVTCDKQALTIFRLLLGKFLRIRGKFFEISTRMRHSFLKLGEIICWKRCGSLAAMRPASIKVLPPRPDKRQPRLGPQVGLGLQSAARP